MARTEQFFDRTWLTVSEAVKYHLHRTPRLRPIHRSAVYRWLASGRIVGEERGGTLYVERKSLEAFCSGRPANRRAKPQPADARRGLQARRRILENASSPSSEGSK